MVPGAPGDCQSGHEGGRVSRLFGCARMLVASPPSDTASGLTLVKKATSSTTLLCRYCCAGTCTALVLLSVLVGVSCWREVEGLCRGVVTLL